MSQPSGVANHADVALRAFAAADLGWWEFDPVSNIATWSPKCRQLFGLFSDSVITYADWAAAVHPDDFKRAEEKTYEALQTTGAYDEEYRTIGIEDGKLRWVRSIAKVEYDSVGKAVRMTGILIETTKSKIAAAVAEESTNRLKLLADSMPQLVWITEPDGYHDYYNRRWFEYTGLTYEQTKGEGWNAVLHPDDLQRTWDVWRHSLQTGEPYEIEYRIRRHDGEYCWFLGRALPMRDEKGVISKWFGTCTDIHDQKEAAQKLTESERRFRTLAQNTPALITRHDKEFRHLYISPTVERLSGHQPEKILGKTYHELDFPETLCQFWDEHLALAFSTKQPHKTEYSIELNSEEVHFLSQVEPEFNEQGEVESVLVISTDVTQLKKTELAMRENEKRFRSLAENSPDLITRHGKDFRYLYVNSKIEGLTGVPPEEFIGKSYYDLPIPQDLCPIFDEHLSRVFQSGKPHEMEYTAFAGKEVNIYSRLVPEFNVSGEIESVLVISTDVTEQKKVERSIRESELRFQTLIREATVGIVVLEGPEMKVTIVNDAYARLVGRQATELLHKPLFSIVPEAEKEFRPLLTSVMESELPLYLYDQYYRVYDSEGREVSGYLNLVYQPYKNVTGEVVGVMALCHDVTEQKKSERALQESEAQFRTLANSIPQLAWMANADGAIHWYNDRWFEFTGATLEDMRGWGWQKVHHPDHVERVTDFAKQTYAGTEPVEITFPMRRHDGVYRWFLTRVYPLKSSDGKVQQWLGTNTDITDQKEAADLLEQKVAERTAELEVRNKELEQFTYVSHHDLQEPLRKIIMFSDMVRKEESEKLSAAAQIRLDRVINAARRMSGALRDVLDYASISKQEQFVPVDLDEVLAGVQTDLELTIVEKGAKIVSDTLPVVKAIPHQMQQLFYNLLNNALKFTKPGVAPQVSVACRLLPDEELAAHPELSQKQYYEISVADNGIGFDSALSKKIFVLFQRLHSKDAYPGTGIGLALCQKVLMNHGGKIWAESEEGKGATFTLLLPVIEE